MKVSHVLLVVFLGSNVLVAEGFSFSLGLVSLGVAGLTGLKLYFGMKMFAPRFRRARGDYRQDPESEAVSDSEDQKFQFDLNITLPELPKREHSKSPEEYKEGTGPTAPASQKVRRDISGGLKLNKSFLRWLKTIDEKKCIHRFFCDLGTDRSKFGSLGRLTNILISMGGLPKGNWAQEMFEAGQDGKPCPQTCDEHELSKTVDYLGRHFFVRPLPRTDSESEENEIPS